MTPSPLECRNETRRELVRASELCGIDYVEVSADQRTLYVHLLGNAPDELRPADGRLRHLRLEAPAAAQPVTIVAAAVRHDDAPDRDDVLELAVDRPGDFSVYRLRLVDVARLDPIYGAAEVRFKSGCPSELDCATVSVCPPERAPEPELDHLAKDYATFRRLILDRLSLIMPGWTERHVPDVGIALTELLAYVGDELSYYQDAVATEAYLDTARRRISVRRHGRLVDFLLHEGCNARVLVCIETDERVQLQARDVAFIDWPDAPGDAGAHEPIALDDLRAPIEGYTWFEPAGTSERLVWTPERNRISLHTWGDTECCLPEGATSAALRVGRIGQAPWREPLRAGDVLVFEEVLNPADGRPEGADRTHRQAVRLTAVEFAQDELLGWELALVRWDPADALRFALCVSALTTDCRALDDVSIAHGNVVLADHGRRLGWSTLGTVGSVTVQAPCEDEGRPGEVEHVAASFRPVLERGPLTFARPISPSAAASELVPAAEPEAPRDALPQLWLRADGYRRTWTPRPDLLSSAANDAHVVVEVDDERRAHLRFGDGELGARPEPGTTFEVEHRVGSGRAGNAGADTIVRLVLRGVRESGRKLRVRNPLPAAGGVDPEPLREAKLLVPDAPRAQIERAITADDYARLAERTPGVQRAAAVLRWTGGWFEARVAIDPAGTPELSPALRDRVRRSLERYRRIGHDVRVVGAEIVPLWIGLDVCVAPNRLRGHVRAALLDAFSARVLPDGRLGFFHPDRLSFGGGIYLSALVTAAVAVPGVQSARVTRLQRRFGGPAGALDAGVLPLEALEVARLDNDPARPENGLLEINLRGGR